MGTCVGLAMHCDKSGVGGIIHLLLPEPISPQSGASPEKYATTGVPLFIQAMVDAGAQRDSLSACLAGGALVGPLRQQDLDLDIGGRTTEAVKVVLDAENIAITQSETGGFFTCCLSLDMNSGQIAIEPAGQSKLSSQPSMQTPAPEEIKTVMNRLKPIPQVALKVLRLIDQNKYDIASIAEEIRKDQVITARTLQLANSAMFAVKRTIESLDHAIIFLGQDLLVRLVLSAAVQSYYEQSAMGYALCKGGIYHHSLGCAQMAEALARKTDREDPGRAYTAGLLHDIGKVVLDQYISDSYPLFYRTVIEEKKDIMAIERRVLGIDHTEVGGILAQQWSFPAPLEHVIRHHHQPDQSTEFTELSTIVYLSDLLMSRFHSELEIERMDTHALTQHIDTLGLTNAAFADLVDMIPPVVINSTD